MSALLAAPYSWAKVMDRAEAMTHRRTGVGRCLETSMLILGVGATNTPSAQAAIRKTTQMHENRNTRKGAHGLFSHVPYGHSVICAGGNRIWSTDIAGNGTYSLSTIETCERRWGVRWVGWATDYCGRYQLDVQGCDDNGHVILAKPDHPVVKPGKDAHAVYWRQLQWQTAHPDELVYTGSMDAMKRALTALRSPALPSDLRLNLSTPRPGQNFRDAIRWVQAHKLGDRPDPAGQVPYLGAKQLREFCALPNTHDIVKYGGAGTLEAAK